MTAVVAAALLFWVVVFTVFFVAQGSSPFELLRGRLAPPPDDLGEWKVTDQDSANGFSTEERYLLPSERPNAPYYLHQVRYRDLITGEVTHVVPERRVPRRRVGSRGT